MADVRVAALAGARQPTRRPRLVRLLCLLGVAAVLRSPRAAPLAFLSPEFRRGALTRLVGVLPLALGSPKPASAGDIGSQLAEGSGVGALFGLDTAEAKLFAADMYSASDVRVKVRFSTPWPVRSDGYGGFKASFEARKSNQYPGEAAFTQVVKRIGVDSVEALKDKQLLQKIFENQNFADSVGFEPENVRQSGKGKTLTGPGGGAYRVLPVKYVRVGKNGLEVDSRAYLSATVVAGDLFAFVATCRDTSWEDSQKRMKPAVESFQVTAA